MPTLPAPLPFVPGGGELPVNDADDVRAVYPRNLRGPAENAPVREAIVEGQLATQLAYQERSAYAAAQADPTRATGIYLDGHAGDRGIFRQEDEDDESLRARMLAVPDIVTPAAIIAAVNAILAPYTSIECQYFESILDRWFVRSSAGLHDWRAFVGANPSYASRLYDQRQNSKPGGAWVFDGCVGRYFVVRVPILNATGVRRMWAFDGSVNLAALANPDGAWINDGSNVGGTEATGSVATFIGFGAKTALEVYQAIANSVNAIKGHGVRWQLIADIE